MSNSVEGSLFVKIGFVMDAQALDDVIESAKQRIESSGIGDVLVSSMVTSSGDIVSGVSGAATRSVGLVTESVEKMNKTIVTMEQHTKRMEEAVIVKAETPRLMEVQHKTREMSGRYLPSEYGEVSIFEDLTNRQAFAGFNEYYENWMRDIGGFQKKKTHPLQRYEPSLRGFMDVTREMDSGALITTGAATAGGDSAGTFLGRLLGAGPQPDPRHADLRERLEEITSGKGDVTLERIIGDLQEGGGTFLQFGYRQPKLTEEGARKAEEFSSDMMEHINERMKRDPEFYTVIMEVISNAISESFGARGTPISLADTMAGVSRGGLNVETSMMSLDIDKNVASVINEGSPETRIYRIATMALANMLSRGGEDRTRGEMRIGIKERFDKEGRTRGHSATKRVMDVTRDDLSFLGELMAEGNQHTDKLLGYWASRIGKLLIVESGIEFPFKEAMGIKSGRFIARTPADMAEERKESMWDAKFVMEHVEEQRLHELEVLANLGGHPLESVRVLNQQRQKMTSGLYGVMSPSSIPTMHSIVDGLPVVGDIKPLPESGAAFRGAVVPMTGDPFVRAHSPEDIGEVFDGTLEQRFELIAEAAHMDFKHLMEDLKRLAAESAGKAPEKLSGRGEGFKRKDWTARAEAFARIGGVKSSPRSRSGGTTDILMDMHEKEFGKHGGTMEEDILQDLYYFEVGE